MIDKWTEYCQKVIGRDNWHPWKFRRVENGVLCGGAVCPLKTRGKMKGEPNYRKHDPLTVSEVFIPQSELDKMK